MKTIISISKKEICDQFIGEWGRDGVCGGVPKGDSRVDNTCKECDQSDFAKFHAPFRDGRRGWKWEEGNGSLSVNDISEATGSRCPWITVEARTNREDINK